MAQSLPLVSVIIPTHNSERYLNEVIQDIINQDYGNIEVLLIDDGSSDGTVKICLSAAERFPCVSYFNNLYNPGAGGSRNLGIEKAHGEWLIFLDSDDMFNRNMISELVKSAVETNSDVVICDYTRLIESTNSIVKSGIKEFPNSKTVSPDQLGKSLLTSFGTAPWNKLVSAKLFDLHNITFQNCAHSNDVYGVSCALLEANSISFVDEQLMCYRVGTNSNIQSKALQRPLEILHPIRQLIERYVVNDTHSWRAGAVIELCVRLLRGIMDRLDGYKTQQTLWNSARDLLTNEYSLDLSISPYSALEKPVWKALLTLPYDKLVSSKSYRLLSMVPIKTISSHRITLACFLCSHFI